MKILPFHSSHQQALIELILPIQQQEFALPITLEDQADLLDIDGFYRRGCGNFWVAVESGRVLGSIAMLDIGEKRAALRKMFVAASHRGAGQGVAKALLDTLMARARQQGMREILLGTTAQFLAAHRFYEKNGFKLIERDELPASFPVMAVDTRFYICRMEPAATETG